MQTQQELSQMSDHLYVTSQDLTECARCEGWGWLGLDKQTEMCQMCAGTGGAPIPFTEIFTIDIARFIYLRDMKLKYES